MAGRAAAAAACSGAAGGGGLLVVAAAAGLPRPKVAGRRDDDLSNPNDGGQH